MWREPEMQRPHGLVTVRPPFYWRALEDLNLWPSDS